MLKLSKALYGLRKAPQAWNTKLDCHLTKLGFEKCTQEKAMYTRGDGDYTVVVGVYVDDLIITGSQPQEIQKFKNQMLAEFDMTDLGKISYYLGIEINQEKGKITLVQSSYAKKILSQFGMLDSNLTKSPMESKSILHKDLDGEAVNAHEYGKMVGCLRYLTHTRPDLSYAVGMVSRYMERPTKMHSKTIKQILRYIRGNMDYGLVYARGAPDVDIVGYSDSDLAGDLDDRRSTGGMAFYVNDSLVVWGSHKQRTIALSSCEAEFMAASEAAEQAPIPNVGKIKIKHGIMF